MKISIILPTKNNITSLARCLKTLEKKTYNGKNLEVLLGVNDDDHKTIRFIENLKEFKFEIKKILIEKNKNYFDLAEIKTEIAKKSSGELFFTYSDDDEMLTEHWDKILIEKINKLPQDKIYLLFPSHNQINSDIPLEIIISRKWFETINKFNNTFEGDTEMYIISKLLNRIFKIHEIKIYHHADERERKKDWIDTRGKLLKGKYYHENSILTLKNLVKMIHDYKLLKNKIYNIKSKNFSILKVYLQLPYYILKIYFKTKLNFFKVLVKQLFFLKSLRTNS